MQHGRGMGGGGGGGYGLMRQMRRDSSVVQQEITKGTAKRMLTFARPYTRILIFFMVVVVIEAVITVANPLLFREIINEGIAKHDTQLIVSLALVVAALAVADAGLSIAERWVSAKVGEGLIYDMRSQVFEPHPEDADRLLHPDPDRRPDQPAEQRRARGPAGLHRHPLLHRLQSGDGGAGADHHVHPVVADHPGQPHHPPHLRGPGQAGGPEAVGHHPGVVRPQRPDEQHHERAVQRVGRPAGQAVRPSGRGERRLRRQGGPGPGHRGHPGHVLPHLHRRPHPHRRPGHRRRLRLGRGGGGGRATSTWGRWWPWPPCSPGSTAPSPRCPTCRSTS